MLKPFLRNSGLYGIATVVSRGIQILLVPLYTRLLLPEEYGSIDLLIVIAAIVQPLLTSQIMSGLGRSLGDATSDDQRTSLASTALWYTVGGAAVLLLVAVFGGGLAQYVLGPGTETLFRIGLAAIAVQMIYSALLEQLRWEQRPVPYGVVSVVFTLVSSAASLALIVWLETGVIGVFYGQLIGAASAGAIAALLARDRYRLRFDRQMCREMLAYSRPLMVAALFSVIAAVADRLVLNFLLGRDAVGVYGIGTRVATTVSLLLAGFAAALEPMILIQYRDPQTPAHLARLLRIFAVVLIPVVLALSLFADEIVRLLATPEYYGAADVIPPLTVATLVVGATMFMPGLALARRTRLVVVIMAASSALNVGLCFALIPLLGVTGAAVATLLSSAAVMLAYLVASQRLYPVPHSWRRLLLAAALVAITAVAGYALRDLSLTPGLAIAAKLGLLATATALLIPILLDRHDRELIRDRIRRRHLTLGA